MKRIAQVVVDNRLRVNAALSSEVREKLEQAFTHKNPQRDKADKALARLGKGTPFRVIAALRAQQKNEPKYITTWGTDGGPTLPFTAPRGGLVRLREVLEAFDYELEVLDNRTDGVPNLRHAYTHGVELRDYQAQIVEATREVEQGIIRSATGSGKTTALIAAAVAMGLPALIGVHRGALLDQWVRRLVIELGIDEDEIGVIAGSKRKIRPITVGMLQTLKNCAHEFSHVFGFLGVDEVHLAAASTFSAVVDQFPARYRLGVSDDERRKDRKEFLIYDLFGERIAETDRDELVDRGVIFDVEIRLIPTTFERGWWDRAPEATRPQLFDRLVEELTQDAERNRLLLEVAHGEAKKGERLLFFSHRVEHCENLRALFAARDPRVGLMVGGKPNEGEFSRSIAGLLDGSVVAGFGTYQALGASIDLPNVGRGIACTPIHNNRQFVNQVRGRICRRPEGKVDAILYYPFDVRIFGLAPAVNLARIARVAKVLEGGRWVEAKGWIKAEKARRQEEEDD